MATCKDCIHYDVCQDLRYGDISDCDCNNCGGFFKNKANYVEVVRCENCKYWEKGKSYNPYCNNVKNLFEEMESTDYCSYGERKDVTDINVGGK